MKNSNTPIPSFSLIQKIRLVKLGLLNWNIPTHLTSEELFQLYKITSSFKKRINVVEIGSYLGASSCFISLGISSDSKVFCVDTWQNDAMSEGQWDTFSDFMENTRAYKNKIVPIRGRSEKAAKNFIEEIDILFIDGDHSYNAVRADFSSWFPKLRKGGVLIMHDIGWAIGVQKLFSEEIQNQVEKIDSLPNLIWGWKK